MWDLSRIRTAALVAAASRTVYTALAFEASQDPNLVQNPLQRADKWISWGIFPSCSARILSPARVLPTPLLAALGRIARVHLEAALTV